MLVVRRYAWLILLWFYAALAAVAQQNCPLPASLKPIPLDKNIFSDQQESDLGDVMAESAISEFTVIHDDALAAHLRQIGERVTKYLPSNQFRFRFYLMDFPVPNAFSLAGGRIYVSRKIVALAHSDDEIAGLISHELGHAVTHQIAIEMTRRMQEVLGVTKVGDRADIEDKYHRLLDTWRTKRIKSSVNEESGQEVADQIAVYAAARAGFSPQGGVDLLDRTLQTHGKTGGWLADLFDVTTPEQHRLREMVKNMRSLPPACVESASPTKTEEFQKWQAEVVAYDVNAHATELLAGIISKQTLSLPLRPDIYNVRFSPDGKLVLAQDYGGIHILSREQLSVLFFIEAVDAHNASFSPDSKSVVFYTPTLRVEVWDIATQKQTSAHELTLRDPCVQGALSPNGAAFACLGHDFSLSIFEVASGATLLTKKDFVAFGYNSNPWLIFFLLELLGTKQSRGDILAHLAFSPDAHYLLAGTYENTVCFDLVQKHEVSLPSSVRNLAHMHFAFVGPDRMVGVNSFTPEKSGVVRFPGGDKIKQIPLAGGVFLEPATHGDYFLVGPLKEKPLGIMEIQDDKLISLDRETADMFDGVVLHEMDNGTVALTDMIAKKPGPKIQLQQARLGGIHTVAVSDDFQWLAVSTKTRGAVWDLTHNIRVDYVRGFDGSWFSAEHTLYADFPKKDTQERLIAMLDSLGHGGEAYSVKDEKGTQEGPYFALRKPNGDENKAKGWTLELHDVRNQKTVWTRPFPRGIPWLRWNPDAGTVVMGASIHSDFAGDELKQFPDLKKKADGEDYFLELFDFRKNELLGKLLVSTNKGSFVVEDTVAGGDWAVMEVSRGRVLTYSLSSGQQVGHVFGNNPLISTASGLFAVTTASGEINVYELSGTRLRRHFSFPAGVAYKKFSPDGKRLFVLARDQTAYVLDLDSSQTVAADSAKQ